MLLAGLGLVISGNTVPSVNNILSNVNDWVAGPLTNVNANCCTGCVGFTNDTSESSLLEFPNESVTQASHLLLAIDAVLPSGAV